MKCFNCGAANNKNADCCEYCGSSLIEKASSQPQEQKETAEDKETVEEKLADAAVGAGTGCMGIGCGLFSCMDETAGCIGCGILILMGIFGLILL